MQSQATTGRSPSMKETDRPFQCQEPGCGRRFNRKFTLSEHMKTHTGEKAIHLPRPHLRQALQHIREPRASQAVALFDQAVRVLDRWLQAVVSE
ncbi:hypothetical protein PINS_up020202 [Pythium insidiosum]|nr:hypothetical protein PINS_up020202 [Pythium insidiosum]